MSQAPNPLDQLRDIHAPTALDNLQLAVGWWVVIGLLITLLIYLIYQWFKKRRSLARLKPANAELNSIALMKPNNSAVAQLSALMKRICLIYFHQSQVAGLSGKSWINFLHQEFGQEFFNQEQQQLFSQFAYQREQELDATVWQQLISASRHTIDTIIRQRTGK